MTTTPEEAAAALGEASTRALQVRRADTRLMWMLVCLVVVSLATAVLLSLEPNRAATYSGLLIIALLIAAIVFVVIVGVRIKAYSRAGILWYFGALIVFSLWNAAVTSVSVITHWWAAGQPTYHFGVSEAVGAVPLLVGILILARRRG